MITKKLFKSRLFQQFLEQRFWHANSVDLVWRFNGEDVREEGDWLKDVWYALQKKPHTPVAFDYVRPYDWAKFYDDDFGPMLQLKFEGGTGMAFNVGSVDPDKRMWLAEILHRQVSEIAHRERELGKHEIREGLRHLIGAKSE